MSNYCQFVKTAKYLAIIISQLIALKFYIIFFKKNIYRFSIDVKVSY